MSETDHLPLSPKARRFLDSLGPTQLQRELVEEIEAIMQSPTRRGTPYDDEDIGDPELAGLRYSIAVAGFAIDYIGPPQRGAVYVTAIDAWDRVR